MPLGILLVIALAFAFALVSALTPAVIRLAGRLEFYDHPVGYKGHARPTPYLGGTAVVASFIPATLLFAGEARLSLPLTVGVVVLWALGTIDDRRSVSPGLRVVVEAALAAFLWALDLGWHLGLGSGVDLAITVLWVLAVVNALNLFDNMDGQATTIAGVIAGAIAVLGLITVDQWLAVTGAALCGACVAFLRFNLTSPARIFLGDGGSMPVGFALASIVMIGASDAVPAGQALAMGLLLVGVPALDTALVLISRTRRGIPVLTGGRDHLTHRTGQRLGTASAVAFALGGSQALLAAIALVSYRGGSAPLLVAVALYLLAAGALIALLDRRVERVEAVGIPDPSPTPALQSAAAAREARPIPWRAGLLVALVAVIAASPWHFGYYDATIWAPAGLALLAVLVAVAIARPAGMTTAGGVALAALFALGAWSVISSAWGQSAHQAFVEGDRLLVYGVLLALVLLLVRDARTGALLLGAAGIGVLVLVGAEYLRLAGSDPAGAFLGGRLNAPLGYINGLGTYLILGLWPAVAVAEQRRWPWLAGLGIGCASLITTLLLLSQSRGVAAAVGAAGLVLLVAVPGRPRRAGAFVLLGVGVAAMVGTTDAVYLAGQRGVVTAEATHRVVERAFAVAIVLGGFWALAVAALEHARRRDAAVAVGARRAVAGTLWVAGCVVAIAALGSLGTVRHEVRTQYDAFATLRVQQGGEATSSRLLSGAGNRSDYWRIARGAWRDHPLAGVGAGSYPIRYFRERATTEDVRQPHSIELQTLSELGLVGGLLLAAFLGAVLLAGLKGAVRARSSLLERFVVVAGLGMFASWLVHTSVDWIHLLPGVTALALCAAGVLLRPATPDGVRVASAGSGGMARLAVPALAILALLGVGTLLSRLALSERYATRAQAALATRPEAGLQDANRALRIDGDFVTAYYTRAAALARRGDAAGAELALRAALRAEPQNFVTWALLGDLAVRTGALSAARRRYAAASRLNPQDSGLARLTRDPRPVGSAP